MRFFIFGILALVLIGTIVFALKDPEPEPIVSPDTTTSSVGKYFEDQITARAVADIGQPIEGLDAYLLMRAFPALFITDFAGVETVEGAYEIGPADDLLFVRNESKVISSAEQMISEKGYVTLLDNVSRRLNIPLATIGNVDELIDRIDTGETIEVRLGEKGSAFGISITPEIVLEDSRCPTDVTCIQAGTVRVRALLESGLGSSSQIFELDQEVTTEAETVRLTQVLPLPTSGSSISPAEYVFIFEAMKRNVEQFPS